MGIDRTEWVDPQQVLRTTENSMEIQPGEKPSVWIKRVTGRKPNKRR